MSQCNSRSKQSHQQTICFQSVSVTMFSRDTEIGISNGKIYGIWNFSTGAALGEGFKAAVEALGKIRDGAAQVAERPLNAREALGDAAEDEFGGGEGGVHGETEQGHEPEIGHGFHADGVRGVDVEGGAEIVGKLVDGPELGLVEAGAVDVAEEHGSGKVKLAAGAVEFA